MSSGNMSRSRTPAINDDLDPASCPQKLTDTLGGGKSVRLDEQNQCSQLFALPTSSF